MDFGSVRKKLARGAYAKLEQFECDRCILVHKLQGFMCLFSNVRELFAPAKNYKGKDVFLICSNAMQHNAADTVFFPAGHFSLALATVNLILVGWLSTNLRGTLNLQDLS
ncbi:uncharacterized protein LOC130785016 isoform X4 [Actinidia eriantha]|nr:uncharacterized protein LOC130785016 isoform X4 [Actinidia eriantha]